MLPSHPSIAVVGSGAVGGYYGARLAQHGHEVHFLLRSDYASIRQRGWTVRSIDGDFTLPPRAIRIYDDPAKMPAVDLVVIAIKTTANDQLPRLVTPLLKEQTAILTLQNGLGNEEQLAEWFGPNRVMGGLAFTCINRVGPGQIHHLDHGVIRLGEFNGPSGERAADIARLFNSSRIHCQVLPDLRIGRWDKLVWNVPFNGLGALMDLTTDQLLASPAGEGLVRELMTEVIATAASIGLAFPAEIIEQKIAHTRTMGAYQTSMQIDRRQGRMLEVESILGKPLAIAAGNGVLTPVLQTIYRMLMPIQSLLERTIK